MKAVRIGVIVAVATLLIAGILNLAAKRSQAELGLPTYSPRTSSVMKNFRPTRVYAKKGFHPDYHKEASVFCNGKEVYKISGTKDKYVVDIWSGNHPFYQGGGGMIVKADRIDKFKGKFDGLEDLFGEDITAEQSQAGLELKKQAMESLGIKKEKGKKRR
eukprot:CAMPEP_0167754494 /NCGR_PEP_ID=MMETSP0110_2-20121227/8297_1 /TAXON_ID=629695 /ORGANISM="Gymnochlora sp., Strain CCMP2014" /LENGTH=159 /DNA_ID=CAMNT_0007640371 /DNA_START=26 /DNA_END=505 /DNA_ORIENTATION=+